MTGAVPTRTQALDRALDGVTPDGPTAEDLLAVARVLDGNPFLRRALSDPSTAVDVRHQVVAALFGAKVTPAALTVVQAAAATNWSDGHALVRALERQGIRAVWLWAQAEGRLGQVVDELFAAGQLISKAPELRRAVTDFTVQPDTRRGLVQSVLGAKVLPQTLALAEHAAVTHAATFEDAIARDLDLAGQITSAQVAVVTVAKPLTAAQRTRLAATLAKRAGRSVTIEEVVDPAILGGARVELGDDVIDGTMTARLAEARRHLT
ncbi:MAG: F0F1 ATP synthase subunit delta [Propionibacteriaceae bacterium]|jgi:F-type H+-transporting ATPase subunit delta|nr:F0F1 ATP synthase subunit delta [Propionibacteriaceae bacterium]